MIDADFSTLSGTASPSANCIFTDFHDLEIVLLHSRALERLMLERGSPPKIAAFEAAARTTFLRALLEGVRPLAYLRWLNERDGLGLKFEGLDVAGLVNNDTLAAELTRVVEVVAQRSSTGIAASDLRARCEALFEAVHDLRHVCCGHDVIAALSVGLRKVLGSQRAIDVQHATLETELRLAFDAEEFRRTQLYAALRDWERRNASWTVLAA